MARIYLIFVALILHLMNYKSLARADDVDAFKVFITNVRGDNPIDKSIDEQDRKIIKFWLDATRKDAMNCSLPYIRRLRKKIIKDKLMSDMKNLDQVYNFAQYIIIESCSKGVVEQGRQMAVDRDAKFNLLKLTGSQFNVWVQETANREDQSEIQRSFRFMAEWMLHMVGTDKRNNQTEFIEAWKNGPCRGVLEQLERPNMKSFKDFVRLVDETKFDSIADLVSPSKYYVPMVQCCSFYQSDASLIKVWDILQQREPEIEEHVSSEASYDYDGMGAFSEDDWS